MSLTPEEIQRIVLAEFAYWQRAQSQTPGDDVDAIVIGAIAASANIFAALKGQKAPWHHPEFFTKQVVVPGARPEDLAKGTM